MFNFVNKFFFLVITIAIVNVTAENKSCSIVNILDGCPMNETCVQLDSSMPDKGQCKCSQGYKDTGSGCMIYVSTSPAEVTTSPSAPAKSEEKIHKMSIFWILGPFGFLFAIVFIAQYGKSKKWVERINTMRLRRYNNVLVTSQGEEDDPPIA